MLIFTYKAGYVKKLPLPHLMKLKLPKSSNFEPYFCLFIEKKKKMQVEKLAKGKTVNS
jgi:hypothetical protein